ncbi:hypothetical protein CZ787_13175 [Halomonas citrativorans]|uniref:Uncharacterized protein n=1 Tax=Halomonas citrativorans TaxID=2742612 RepID=A0A1R4I2N4_9GAMM|nr:hypothetical protein [Halomonas citrativorans]SJN14045.1 hypothetical protein CZ787_13175 [Halomonas citrativorans]
MQHIHLSEISQAGLQLAIQEIKDEMFDTPECDYTIAKLLCHCSQFETAEHQLDEMLLKWGSSPDVIELTDKGYAMIASAVAAVSSKTPRQAIVAA